MQAASNPLSKTMLTKGMIFKAARPLSWALFSGGLVVFTRYIALVFRISPF